MIALSVIDNGIAVRASVNGALGTSLAVSDEVAAGRGGTIFKN